MARITITGNIHLITPEITVSATFSKRELVLNDPYIRDGQQFNNYIKIEVTGQYMQILDAWQPGQRVMVDCILSGREYIDRNGQAQYITSIKGLAIRAFALEQPQQSAPALTPAPQQHTQPQYQQQPQPQYQQPQGYPQQPPRPYSN